MLISLSSRDVYAGLGLLMAFAAVTFDSDAQASIVTLKYNPTVSGGSRGTAPSSEAVERSVYHPSS
jgi:hypothetical protein